MQMQKIGCKNKWYEDNDGLMRYLLTNKYPRDEKVSLKPIEKGVVKVP